MHVLAWETQANFSEDFCPKQKRTQGPLFSSHMPGRQSTGSLGVYCIFAAISFASFSTPSRIFAGGTVTKLKRSVFFSGSFA